MKYPLTVILVIFYCGCNAQFQKFSHELFFNRFSTDDGLSQASVNAILRDSKGFIWFGTDDGLNRYDGNQFKVYKKKPGDSTSISGNTIETLWEDSLSRLWVGTSEGISVLDRHIEKFKTYQVPGKLSHSCSDFQPDPDNNRIWIAAGTDGLYYVDLQRDTLLHFNISRQRSYNVLKLCLIDRTLYLGTANHGLLALNLTSNLFQTVPLETDESIFPAIRALEPDQDLLWVGTEGDGLKKFNTITKEIETYSAHDHKIGDDKVWSLAVDSENVWVGTVGGGLTIFNKKTSQGSIHKHSYYNLRSLSSNTIRSIAKDKTGDMWFGTFNGGVSYLPAFNIKFHTFRKEPEVPNTLAHNSVLSFHELHDGTLLIGTDGGGLLYLKGGKFYKYAFPSHVKIPSAVLSLKETSAGDIYVGTYQEGLYRISKNGRVSRFVYDPENTASISSNIVWDIEEDDDGSIWLATDVGLNRLYPWDNEFTNHRNKTSDDPKGLFTSDLAQTLLLDSAKTLWIGYFGMLQSYYVPTGKITNFRSGDLSKNIPNKQILSLNLDPSNKNVIWFSSFGSGLTRLNNITKKFTHYTEEDGLPNNLISAVQADRNGMVWLTCNKGLVRFNPAEKSFYTFEKSFGVNIAPFRDNASGITSSGYLMFGGTNGFTAFWPNDVNFQKRNLDVIFTGFSLFNEDVPIDHTILTKSITETSELNIPYDKARFLTLQFSVPNFLAPSMVQYQYKLEGFEENWHVLQNKNISFTNLLPGHYKLKVKAGFPSGIWGDEKMLAINVVPPWWMTWYSRAALFVVILGLSYGFYVYRTYSLHQRKVELETIVANQNQEIIQKNRELADQNEALSDHNRALLTNRETISKQNKLLFDAQQQLKEVNQSLELLVQQRTEKLNETITQLNKTIRELDAFLYSASHDLVSPLKSILGLVNLAKRENVDPNMDYYFNHIEISVKKLEAIIHMLMQHSFNTKAQLNFETVDLRAIIEETLLEVRFLPDAEKIKFSCQFKKVSVVTDIYRLKIVLSNILSNAVKYQDPLKKKNVVNLKYSNGGDTWMLDITDNGIGIEKDRIPRVFDMFYRATESAKGSGLGLYIVKDTMDRLGGCVAVDSEIGQWTRFTVSLPVQPHITKDTEA